MSDTFAVTVAVTRPDGTVEQVRVGTATKSGEGFRLTLDSMSIGATAAPARAPSRAGASSGGAGGDVFPNYGRSKGMPISGATMQDLEYYAAGAKRSLADPSKERFHAKERALLATIDAEVARQQGGGGGGSGMPDDSSIPPPGDEEAPF